MKLWTMIYYTRHGEFVFPLWCEDGYEPSREDGLSLLDDYEEGEDVHIEGPMDVPERPDFGRRPTPDVPEGGGGG
jgi:hypothetical protein